MSSWVVEIPVKGFHAVLVEADTLEEAIAYVKVDDFDPDARDDDGDPVYGGMSVLSTCNADAKAPERETLIAMEKCFSFSNEIPTQEAEAERLRTENAKLGEKAWMYDDLCK